MSAMAAVSAIERHADEAAMKEAQRKKWVETKDGKEFLFVTCETCDQPHARQEVLRVTADGLALWHKTEEDEGHAWSESVKLNTRTTMALIVTCTIVGGLISLALDASTGHKASAFYISLITIVAALFGLTVAMRINEKVFTPRYKQACARCLATKKEILAQTGVEVEPRDVSTVRDAYPAKYVLMAKEGAPAE